MKENRLKKMMSLRLTPELIRDLDEWCKKQRPPVTKTGVIETAVRDFIEARKAQQ